jgi:hypothetical protein
MSMVEPGKPIVKAGPQSPSNPKRRRCEKAGRRVRAHVHALLDAQFRGVPKPGVIRHRLTMFRSGMQHRRIRMCFRPWRTHSSCGCGWYPCPDVIRMDAPPVTQSLRLSNGPTAQRHTPPVPRPPLDHIEPAAVKPTRTTPRRWHSERRSAGVPRPGTAEISPLCQLPATARSNVCRD